MGFLFGLVLGLLVGPFAWNGVRWCLKKFKGLLK